MTASATRYDLQRRLLVDTCPKLAALKQAGFFVNLAMDVDILSSILRVNIFWTTNQTPELTREITLCIPEFEALKVQADVAQLVEAYMSRIDVRCELVHFKLHKKFPNRVAKVELMRDIEQDERKFKFKITFKSGRGIEVSESKVDSDEFIAACAMIYDL